MKFLPGSHPTVAQMKLHKERRTKKAKAKACLFAAVSPSIFIKIMKIDSAAEIWEYLNEEYKGDERIKNMQVMNLIREFEMKKIRESDAVKDYAAQLLSIADKVRLLGKEFSNEKIVQKILLDRIITFLGGCGTKKTHETRRYCRRSISSKNAEKCRHKNGKVNNKKSCGKNQKNGVFSTLSSLQEDKSFSTKCWWRPDVKCNKCGKQGNVERICKNQQQEETSAAVDYCQEEQLFAATCFANKSTSKSWLVDSGCTNHMTNNQDLFRELDRTTMFQSQNWKCVGQLVEKEFKVYFEDRNCIIKDAEGKEVFNIKIEGQEFCLEFTGR
ncbi:hypothetical protein CK203_036356 [Vitis vinifera]|uniref:Retrovirus-related Pol polyprotein from transposon TNT 1-94-like beta-barrel domain-containing protein n=1 Tax=Vitis vinifera TaxID=29760 RepID=A0A438HSZ5_VITVI|nr:hypothetical protein CK203_036356 [Vitis vinifera]